MLPLTMPLKDMDILCDTIATISDNPTGAPVHVGIFFLETRKQTFWLRGAERWNKLMK